MSKDIADIIVMATAFAIGVFISAVDNPLTASFTLIAIMLAWELLRRLPGLKKRSRSSMTTS